MNAQVSYNDPK